MKLRFAMMGTGLCALMIAACATDDPSASSVDPEDNPALDEPDTADALDGATSLPTDLTPVDVPGVPAGSVMVGVDGASSGRPCPAGWVCLYQNPHYTGCEVEILPPAAVPDLSDIPCNNGNFNNQMSSWKNRSDSRYCWWTDKDEHGHKHVMEPHTRRPVLSPGADNRASSVGPC